MAKNPSSTSARRAAGHGRRREALIDWREPERNSHILDWRERAHEFGLVPVSDTEGSADIHVVEPPEQLLHEEEPEAFEDQHVEETEDERLSQEEIEPELMGDLKLIDVEDFDEAEVTIGGPLIKKYKQNLAAYRASLQEFCMKRSVTYLFTSNQVPFDRLVLTYLRQRGLVK